MANLPSLPAHARMGDLLARFPDRGAILMRLGQQFLRGESELSASEREIVFAYGSALNDCEFCHLSHKYTAAELGIDEAVWSSLLNDIDSAPVEDRLKPILRLVRKLTLTPSAMDSTDIAEVLAAGWSEDAVFDAVLVCGFSNLMNRVVDATGLVGTDDEHRESGVRLSTLGYDATMPIARASMPGTKATTG